MKKNIKTGAYATLLFAAAVMIVTAAKPQSSSAYFTAYDSAAGSVTVDYSIGNKLEEDIPTDPGHLIKVVTVTNTGNTEAFARVRILAGTQIGLKLEGNGWYLSSDGYIYYSSPLAAGEKTAELTITLTPADGFNSDFNVVVAEETVPVQYDDKGDAFADWEMRMNIE